jgi:hypothetical protein
MHKFFLAALLALPAAAQTQPTASELLQRGIYAQETAGDLDGAIKIFRQIVDSHPQQREIGAQAQYRLGMTLLAKGDSNGASQEIQRLGWDYPDYNALIASANKANGAFTVRLRIPPTNDELQNIAEERDRALFNAGVTAQNGNGPIQIPKVYNGQNKTFFFQGFDSVINPNTEAFRKSAAPIAQHEAEFDWGRTATIAGTVVQIAWMNPYTILTINSASTGSPTRVFVAAADALMRADWTRDTLKLGNQVIITGSPAIDGSGTLQATEVNFNGKVLFSRPNGPMPQNAVGAYER